MTRVALDASVINRAPKCAQTIHRTKTVWIDLDNSPHVPFFVPIIRELEVRGYRVLLTARKAFQVEGLLRLYNLDCRCIGHHTGRNRIGKLVGLLFRSIQLVPSALEASPDLAVSHGSRAQLVVASSLRIPTLHIGDYEHAKCWAVVRPSWILVPEVIADDRIQGRKEHILHYPGIKEDVYVPSFTPDRSIRGQIGFKEEDIVVTVRPPASEAHYHNPKSDELFDATLHFLSADQRVRIILLPRNDRQASCIRERWGHLFRNSRILIPERVINGLDLIWFSDLVISGGGTMNREAAALGVPVYSIFRGKIGAVDEYLSGSGRMVMIQSPEELPLKVRLAKRDRPARPDCGDRDARKVIVDHITTLLKDQTSRNQVRSA